MNLIRIVGVVLSLLVAVAAVWVVNSQNSEVATKAPEPVKKLSLVVATEPLRYGQKITAAQVKTIEWLGETIPQGGFETVESLGIDDSGPYAMTAIGKDTPVLRSQLTAPGQKPSLSARLRSGEVAVTIPVNTITGVAGFVLPEERVDVILNRRQDNRLFADIVLQNIRVLAVNSMPDAAGGEPVQAKSVTFATAREDAQKLVVASGMGEISLVLRSPTGEGYETTRSISDLEVVPRKAAIAPQAPVAVEGTATNPVKLETLSAQPAVGDIAAGSQVIIVRGLETRTVTVP